MRSTRNPLSTMTYTQGKVNEGRLHNAETYRPSRRLLRVDQQTSAPTRRRQCRPSTYRTVSEEPGTPPGLRDRGQSGQETLTHRATESNVRSMQSCIDYGYFTLLYSLPAGAGRLLYTTVLLWLLYTTVQPTCRSR